MDTIEDPKFFNFSTDAEFAISLLKRWRLTCQNYDLYVFYSQCSDIDTCPVWGFRVYDEWDDILDIASSLGQQGRKIQFFFTVKRPAEATTISGSLNNRWWALTDPVVLVCGAVLIAAGVFSLYL